MQLAVVFHALLMVSGVIIMAVAVVIAMTQRKKRWWLKVHRPFGIAGALSMIAGLFIMALTPADSRGSGLITEMHGIIGGSAIALVFAAPILGMLMFRLKKKWMRPTHRWAGRFAIVIAFTNLTLGLFMTGLI
jgi:hypothetical protein